QNDLAAPHARRLAAGERELERLFEVALAQAPDVRGIPVVDLARAARQRFELRQGRGAWRLKRVWLALQVMLENPVDHVDVVEDAQHDRTFLGVQARE